MNSLKRSGRVILQHVFIDSFSMKIIVNDTDILQYLIIHGVGLCIKFYNFVAHMFYAWSFNHNTAVPIDIHNNKYFLSLNINTTVFAWGSGNNNNNRI